MKRVKIFDNQDDLYTNSQTKDEYENENKIIDCAHLIQNENSSNSSDSSDTSESEDEQRFN